MNRPFRFRFKELVVLGGVCFATVCTVPACADTEGHPMTFERRVGKDGEPAIFADGVVTPDTPDALLAFLDRSEPMLAKRVFLNSDGGDLQAGIDLGRLIRRLQLNTYVGSAPTNSTTPSSGTDMSHPAAGRCVSACALAFLGGVRRQVDTGSIYAVHQLQIMCTDARRSREKYPWLPIPGAVYCPGVDDAIASIQTANAALVEYVGEMGADAAYLRAMAEAGPDRLNVLDRSQMLAFGIVTDSERPR